MGFLKFLFFVIIFYYLFKLISRYVLPYLLSVFVRKAQDRMMENEGSYKQKKKEGEINIDYSPDKTKKGKKDSIGDYVDFEEIDD